MKRFFFLSIFFHGALLLILFSREMPLADKLFPMQVIEVALIQSLPVSLEKKEERKPARQKEPSQPLRKKEEEKAEEPAPLKEDLKEEQKEEELLRKEETVQGSSVTAKEEKPAEAEKKNKPSPTDGEGGKALNLSPVLAREFKAGEGSGPAHFVWTASLLEKGETEIAVPKPGTAFMLDKGEKKVEGINPGTSARGEISALPAGKILSPSDGVDPTLKQIIRKIEAAKHYPRAAKKMGIEGKVVVRFKLQPQGQVEALEIYESSGSEILDKASLQTVRDAAPLPYKEGWLKVGIVFKIL